MNTLAALVSLFPVVLIGCLLPFLGRSRRGLLFGVTVPLEFAESAEAKTAISRYRSGMILLGAAVVIAAAVMVVKGRPQTVLLLDVVAIPLELVGAMLLWQGERRAMKRHATTVPLVRTAELLPKRHTGGLWASATAVLPLVAVGLWLKAQWALIPDRWPQHWDAYGHANGWGTRDPAGVFGPVFVGMCLVALMTCVAGFVSTAPGPQSKQRRLVTAPIAGLAWLMSGTFCVIGLLPLRHDFTRATIITMIVVHMLATVGVVVWLLVRSGMMTLGQAGEDYDGTPDSKWRGGILYYNPGDAAVIVPKRYGFGWTLNFARPLAWVYIGGVVLVVALVSLVPMLLHG